MKNLLLAAALTFAPTASQAAVTINFTGTTFPYDESTPLVGSYVDTTAPDGTVTRNIDTGPQSVSGKIVIDTTLAGADTDPTSNVNYGGKGFITLTFASSGATPTILSGTLSEQAISSTAGENLIFDLFDEADTYAFSFRLFGFEDLSTSIFDGLLLPDFRTTDLFFSAVSLENIGDTSRLAVSSGFVNTITQTVPEPSTWAMMLVGFGMVGAGPAASPPRIGPVRVRSSWQRRAGSSHRAASAPTSGL